ncbi:appr-1-p processing domain-containing protein [marine bacterium AO1-C]|nr:appr-1-p processing domain-containing protein [marine bacterium AO1-C]
MINLTKGNLFESTAQAIVNPVNTVGVMGKGLALQFKERYPENFKHYRQAFETKELTTGKMLLFEVGEEATPRYIINFPTKKHWRGKSKMEYIEDGMVDFVKLIQTHDIQSVAIPPLGAGWGGLDWEEVKACILKYLEPLEEVEFWIYEPK